MIAEEMGIDPATIKLTTDAKKQQINNQGTLRVIVPEQSETIVMKGSKLELALIKSVLRKINEELLQNQTDIVRVNKKIDGSRKLLPVIVEELVG
jgi:hypothetical protein